MAKKSVTLRGVNQVVRNLRRAGPAIQRNVNNGIRKAGRFLFREAQEIVPVDEGNLRGSGFVRPIGKGSNFAVVVGYTADYAVFVHENLNAAHGAAYNVKHAAEIATGAKDNRGEKQQAKFLEAPARQFKGKMIRIIKGEASKRPLI